MQRKLPPLNQVRSFEAAARHQSFSVAASELGVTAAAISSLVKSLEDFLGVLLFHRGASHIRLTQSGKRYLLRLTPALDDIAIATAEVTGDWRNSFTIAAFPSVAQRWLIPNWAEFKNENPEHTIHIKTVLTAPRSNQDDIDAAIRVRPPDDTTMIWDKIHDDELIPVCHPKFADAHPATVQSLITLPRLKVRTRQTDWVNWFRHMDIDYDPVLLRDDPEFHDLPMAIAAAVQGMGIVIAIKSLIQPELSSGLLVPFMKDTARMLCPFYLTYPPDKAHHPSLQAFHHWILNSKTNQM
ncbi:LysR substrate-binding domain-containing protein [Sneathiella aquimaris]|uniref:LysR substrate-binding domain-containing protein n=1 Tax=Sneathiella aquimaris TaxID=2599305 RepID=UPI001469CA82|nr:LysR substrate-binding domain-containing protein [Sneathiella aquimaris]